MISPASLPGPPHCEHKQWNQCDWLWLPLPRPDQQDISVLTINIVLSADPGAWAWTPANYLHCHGYYNANEKNKYLFRPKVAVR